MTAATNDNHDAEGVGPASEPSGGSGHNSGSGDAGMAASAPNVTTGKPPGTPNAGVHGDHGHGADDHGVSHGTFKSYATGFVLAVVLTAIPFWLVMGKVFDASSTTALVVLGFAAVQIVVHMIYFLHMNTKSEGGWSLLALVFTLILVVITLSGSLWVMYHLNANMMPSMHEMKNMP